MYITYVIGCLHRSINSQWLNYRAIADYSHNHSNFENIVYQLTATVRVARCRDTSCR